jgi:hypothetical protein
MAHNPRQALAAPLTITWLTEPDQIDDDENSTLTVELPKRSRLVQCISEAKEIDLPVSSTPDHCLLDYRWVALIVASVALLDFESLIGSCHIFNSTFELGWTLALLIVLEKELLFDDPVFSLARLLQRLRRWRELKLSDNSLPDECILRESGWSSDSLMVGTWCFDDDYIPWVTDVTFSTLGNPDIYPLMELWLDIGPHFVSAQVATESFWYRTERIRGFVARFFGHDVDHDGPFTNELLLEGLNTFSKGTAWTSHDIAIFSLPPSTRLLQFRMQMA